MTATGTETHSPEGPQSEASEIDEAMAHVDEIAHQSAREIMLHVADTLPDIDEVEVLVEGCCAAFLDHLVAGGINGAERDLALARYRHALVTEGRRISQLLVWDGGTA